jgi:competence protein ComEA
MSFTRRITSFLGILVLTGSMQAFAAQPDNSSLTDANATTATTSAAANEKVNINTATLDQLESLKGIGAGKAQAIIDYRTQHGAFKSVNDLSNVKGMSEKNLANLLKNNPGRITVE